MSLTDKIFRTSMRQSFTTGIPDRSLVDRTSRERRARSTIEVVVMSGVLDGCTVKGRRT